MRDLANSAALAAPGALPCGPAHQHRQGQIQAGKGNYVSNTHGKTRVIEDIVKALCQSMCSAAV